MEAYLIPLQETFEEHRDAAMADAMKRYMKGQYAYFGIKAPIRREITRLHIHDHGLPDQEGLERVIFDCWSLPEREYQYFAMELAGRVARKAELCRVDTYEYMSGHKSWWDTVDYIASNLVGVHFQKFPDAIRDYNSRWMESGNMWLQRVALLFQLKYKKRTDLDLLTRNIEHLLGSREFFINKAIGWILREYSKTDAAWVMDYVAANSEVLAPLSKREALKWLQRKNEE